MNEDYYLDLIDQVMNLYKRLENRLSLLEREMRRYVNKEKFSEEIRELKSYIENIEKNIESFSNLDKNSYNKIIELENKINNLEEQIQSFVKIEDIISLKDELNNNSLKLENLEKETKVLKEIDLINLKQKINEFDNLGKEIPIIKERLEKIENITSSIDEISNNNKVMDKKIKSIESDIENINQKLETIFNQNNDINIKIEEIQKLQKKIKSLEEKISSYNSFDENEIKDIKEIISLKDNIKKMVSIENKISFLAGLINNIENKIKDIISSLSENKQIQEEILMINSNMDNIKKELETLKNDLQEVLDNIYYLNDETDKLELKIKELDNKIKIIDVDNLYEYFEKLKTLQDEIYNIKLILKEGKIHYEQKDYIDKLERDIRILYQRQNEIINDIYNKLNKLERLMGQ